METIEEALIKYKDHSRTDIIKELVWTQHKLHELQILLFAKKNEKGKGPEVDPSIMDSIFGDSDIYDKEKDPEVEPEVEPEAEPEVEPETEPEPEGQKPKSPKPKSPKPRGKRKKLPESLPRIRTMNDFDVEEKLCSVHGTSLTKIGEHVSEKLEIIPSKSFVSQIVTPKYKCKCCENNSANTEIISPDRVPDLLPKSYASPSLLATIATSKYEDALPLYRQEKIYLRHGMFITRNTMARWMINVSKEIQVLINLMHDDLLLKEHLQCDETVLQVLKEIGRKPEQNSYMWCLGSQDIDEPIILFKYYETRSTESGLDLLEGFKGSLSCDGYCVYICLKTKYGIVLSGCFAHVRRKFLSAESSAKKAGQKGNILASEGLQFINSLYSIEKKIKGLSQDEILKVRKEKSVPILEKFHKWMLEKKEVVLPKSGLGSAISYALNIWDTLTTFCTDGRIPIDNNWLESSLRPFVLGRKNWLFSSTPEGAHASANIYSLIESAKANGLCPFDYLKTIFKELPKSKSLEEYENLLPYKIIKAGFKIDPYRRPAKPG